MKKGLAIILGFAVGLGAVAFAQTVQRPQYPQTGLSYVGYGSAFPTTELFGGELFVDVNGQTDGGPLLGMYDDVTSVWDIFFSGIGTQNTVVKFGAAELVDSSITDDATDVVATAGLITSGTAVNAANSILLDGNNNALQFEGGTADAAEIIFTAVDPDTDLNIFLDNPATNTNGTWMEIDGALASQDAGNTWLGIHLDLDSPANHGGAAVIRGIEVDNDTNTVAGEETGLHFTANWDAEIHFADPTAVLWWLETGNFTMQDYGGSVDFILTDMPDHGAADVTVAAMELDVIVDDMDAGDVQYGMFIDITNGANTGGTLYGLHIDDIGGGPADEEGIHIGTGWGNADIRFEDLSAIIEYTNTGTLTITEEGEVAQVILRDVPAVGNANDLVELDMTIGAMDAGGDTFRILLLDITNGNHTNGNLIGIDIDVDTPRANATETAVYANGGWDYTLRQDGIAFAALPAAVVGAMVYCTDCDLASVPCASTPGPGAWAFGTSTGPRWECPW
jgi:hypothetical protein